jgi:hypothetical protein
VTARERHWLDQTISLAASSRNPRLIIQDA